MIRSFSIIFSTVGCIIGWGAFLAPENIFLPKMGLENSILGILIGSFLICTVIYAMAEKVYIFFLEWLLILGYLCISSLNLLNLTVLIQEYLNHSILHNTITLSNFIIIFLCFYLYRTNYKLLRIMYDIFSFFFFLLLFCIEIGIILLLYLNNLDMTISFSMLNFQQTTEMIAISPWLFIGFGYALNQAHKRKIILTIIAICFSSLIYLSIILIIGTSPITSLWKITHHFFGQYGVLFVFFTILFSIISGFIGFVLLALDGNKQIHGKKISNLLFFSLFFLTLLGRENLNLLITIVSLAFSIMFIIYSYLFVKKQKTMLSFFSFFSSLLIFVSSLLPQNDDLYNKVTISILILWLILGLFLRYDYRKKISF